MDLLEEIKKAAVRETSRLTFGGVMAKGRRAIHEVPLQVWRISPINRNGRGK
jgi:hypothetical protein